MAFFSVPAASMMFASGASAPARVNERGIAYEKSARSPSVFALATPPESATAKPFTIDAMKFVDPTRLNKAPSPAAQTTACPTYRGGVVNHHALAADLLERWSAELARCRPAISRIVILSPDHFHAGSAPITIYGGAYAVSGAAVPRDEAFAAALARDLSFVRLDTSAFDREHGVGALVPFLHDVLPKASITGVLVRSDLTREEAERFAHRLSDLTDARTFLAVSSDMSHYLTDKIALANDAVTQNAYAKNRREFFWTATDDFTDNGRAIWITLSVLGDRARWHALDHSISTAYGGSPLYTTTYITGFWD